MELVIFLSLCGSLGVTALYSVVDRSIKRRHARRRTPDFTVVGCEERKAG